MGITWTVNPSNASRGSWPCPHSEWTGCPCAASYATHPANDNVGITPSWRLDAFAGRRDN